MGRRRQCIPPWATRTGRPAPMSMVACRAPSHLNPTSCSATTETTVKTAATGGLSRREILPEKSPSCGGTIAHPTVHGRQSDNRQDADARLLRRRSRFSRTPTSAWGRHLPQPRRFTNPETGRTILGAKLRTSPNAALGHFRLSKLPANRHANDRFQCTADVEVAATMATPQAWMADNFIVFLSCGASPRAASTASGSTCCPMCMPANRDTLRKVLRA
jgi:hypothetical protein